MSLTLIMSLALVAGQDEIPPECRYDAAGRVNYQACADATEPGMVLHSLSLMNLGSIAAMEGDNARAAARYDEASASGGSLHSDSVFHSLRAHVYEPPYVAKPISEGSRITWTSRFATSMTQYSGIPVSA